MSFILLRAINLGGTLFDRGVDITDLATPGEIASLRAAGVIADGVDEVAPPNDPIVSQNDPVVSEKAPIVSQTGPIDSPADPPKMFGLPDRVVKALSEANPPILTEDDAIAYAEQHDDDFSALKGIGDSTSRDIVEAIKASLA